MLYEHRKVCTSVRGTKRSLVPLLQPNQIYRRHLRKITGLQIQQAGP